MWAAQAKLSKHGNNHIGFISVKISTIIVFSRVGAASPTSLTKNKNKIITDSKNIYYYISMPIVLGCVYKVLRSKIKKKNTHFVTVFSQEIYKFFIFTFRHFFIIFFYKTHLPFYNFNTF